MANQYYKKNTTIFEYVKRSYKTKGSQIPNNLLYVLENFNISDIPVEKFKTYFGLACIQVKQLVEFIMSEENSVDIARYGWEIHQYNRYEVSHRKYTTSENYNYVEFSPKLVTSHRNY